MNSYLFCNSADKSQDTYLFKRKKGVMAGETDLCCSNVCFLPLGVIGIFLIVSYGLNALHVNSDTTATVAVIVAIIFGILAFIGRQSEYFKQNKK